MFPSPGEHRSGSAVKAQFALPLGLPGWLAGWVLVKMGRYSGLNAEAIGVLAPAGRERVLEIGFGPGEAIRALAERLPGGHVAGVDPSPVMLARARRRNRVAVSAGRVDLRQGMAEHLPWPDASFEAVISVNSAQLWTPLGAGIDEIRRVLAPDGRVVLALHQHCVSRDGNSVCALDLRPQLLDGLTRAGFTVRHESRAGKAGTSVYVTGRFAHK